VNDGGSPREAAWRALCAYDERHPTWDALLDEHLKGLEGPDRGLAAELIAGSLRHRRSLVGALRVAGFKLPRHVEPPVLNLLRIGAYQLLHLKRVPPHAAIHETVEIAKRHRRRVADFVNAALRQLQRARDADQDITSGMSRGERFSFPDPIVETIERLLPADEVDAALAAMNEPGELGIRINRPGGAAQLTAHPAVPGAWTCPRATLGELQPHLDDGSLLVQDPASQLVGLLGSPEPGARVLDLCAAPGGKTAHLAQFTDQVWASDRDPSRLEELKQNLHRHHADGVHVVPWDEVDALGDFDVILVDAPCTGWGTVRHKPDLKWRAHAPRKLAEAQRGLLERMAARVRLGGSLIYSVCTFLPEETTGVIEGFLTAHPEFTMSSRSTTVPAQMVEPDGSIRTWPHRHACDGFFAVRMQRSL
jgi:16S rRNA (cytosine967-C5)-methyltransferase